MTSDLSAEPAEAAAILRRRWRAEPAAAAWSPARWAQTAAAGGTAWNIPAAYGGRDCSAEAWLQGCLELARGDLTTAFVLSQFHAACQRLVDSSQESLKRSWLPALARGDAFTTVGISHLSTSRQHWQQPPVLAKPVSDGWELSGCVPWVTGSVWADLLVTGAALADGAQLLFAIPMRRAGVRIEPPLQLLALAASETGPVQLAAVRVLPEELLAGPSPAVMKAGSRGGAGSLATSALALGHALSSLDQLELEARRRPNLDAACAAFRAEFAELQADLLAAARGEERPELSAEELRSRATSAALRAAQALLAAAKGTGFVCGHPAERAVREAAFFLVWSCPQSVASQLLKEFSRCNE